MKLALLVCVLMLVASLGAAGFLAFRDSPAPKAVPALCYITQTTPVCYDLESGLEVECPPGL